MIANKVGRKNQRTIQKNSYIKPTMKNQKTKNTNRMVQRKHKTTKKILT